MEITKSSTRPTTQRMMVRRRPRPAGRTVMGSAAGPRPCVPSPLILGSLTITGAVHLHGCNPARRYYTIPQILLSAVHYAVSDASLSITSGRVVLIARGAGEASSAIVLAAKTRIADLPRSPLSLQRPPPRAVARLQWARSPTTAHDSPGRASRSNHATDRAPAPCPMWCPL